MLKGTAVQEELLLEPYDGGRLILPKRR